jgi:hypothetical protein
MEELCYKIFNNFLQVKNAQFIVFGKYILIFIQKKQKSSISALNSSAFA